MSERGEFHEIDPLELEEKVISLIGKEWMLITAGNEDKYNPMTASWGGLGFLWNRPVAFVVVRPQRYTYELIEVSPTFTLTFYGAAHRDALTYCGSYSGRDVDKVAETGLTPVTGATGAVYFEEARLVLECRKLYAQDLKETSFIDTGLVDQHYAARDFHRLYVGEIVRVLKREI